MSDLLKACAICGELSDASKCEPHRKLRRVPAKPPRQKGYNATWDRLSLRARTLQPFCSIPGCNDQDLTTDHSPEAWKRKEKGLVIRLQDVSVLCRSHNSAKGAAR